MVNKVRRKMAFEMMVGRAERVLTDGPLHATIRQSIRCRGAKGTGLLITQVDVRLLPSCLIITDAKQLLMSDATAIAAEIENRTAQPFPTVKRYLEENDQTMEAMQDDGVDKEHLTKRAKYGEYITTLAKLAFIDQRARAQEEEMRYKFTDLDPHPIYVRTVSASSYMSHLKKGFRQRPAITPEMSGIPDVRWFMLNQRASANWNAYQEHAFDKMDMFLDKCRRIMEVKRQDNAFAKILPKFTQHVTNLVSRLQTTFDDFLRNGLPRVWFSKFEKHKCQEHLLHMVQGWGKAHWNTYNKSLRERGTVCQTKSSRYVESGKRVGYINWNEDVSNAVGADMNEFQDRMSTAVSALAGELNEAITNVCADVSTYIRGLILPSQLKRLALEEWKKRDAKITAQLETTNGLFQEAVRLTLQYATTETDIGCMVAQINMQDYETIENIPQPRPNQGSKYDRQKDLMRKAMKGQRFGSPNLADRISRSVTQKAKEELRTAFASFLANTVKEFELFNEHMRDRIPPEYELAAKDRRLREDIVKTVPKIVTMVAKVRTLLTVDEFKDGSSPEPQEWPQDEPQDEPQVAWQQGHLKEEDLLGEDMLDPIDVHAARPTKRIKREYDVVWDGGYWDSSALDNDSNYADWR
jgi:hypothetical protein